MTTYSENPPDTPRNRGDYNAPHMTPVTPEEDIRSILLNRVSWSAVFAGVAMSLAVQLVLNLFGIGIGVATIDPLQGDTPSAAALSIGAMAWWTVAGIIASFLGGFTAGRTAGEPREAAAGWHGLTSWAASILVIALVITLGVGKIVGGTMNLAGMSGAAYMGTKQNAAGVSSASPMRDTVRRVTGASPDTVSDATSTALAAVVNGNPAQADAAREKAAQAISQSKGVSMDEARAEVRDYELKARQAADVTAKNVSRGALLAAFALILGAIAAWVGGRAGWVKPTVTNVRLRAEQLH